jgi:WD repeat-containing protein 42A
MDSFHSAGRKWMSRLIGGSFSFAFPPRNVKGYRDVMLLCVQFDLRCSKSTQLLTCLSFGGSGSRTRRRAAVVRLNTIVMNPMDAHYFAVGGSDEYARVYDVRRPCARAGGADGPVNAFTPRHLAGSDQVHITCVAYSLQEELLASYNDEHIYLFGKAMGLGPDPCRDGSSALDRDASEDEEEEPQVYMGHRNAQTVKGVSFFGPNTEYVVSGSDCGRIFIWKKKGGQLVALRIGDEQVVNCLEPHPFATVLATSGIDSDIKIWMPTATEALPLPDDATQVRL